MEGRTAASDGSGVARKLMARHQKCGSRVTTLSLNLGERTQLLLAVACGFNARASARIRRAQALRRPLAHRWRDERRGIGVASLAKARVSSNFALGRTQPGGETPSEFASTTSYRR